MLDEFIEKKQIKRPKVPISSMVDYELWEFAKQHSISWVESLEIGLRIKLKEMGVISEWPDCSLKRDRDRIAKRFIELNDELIKIQGEEDDKGK